jgi:O-antigen/teichoic acid export membrane protein
MPVILIAGVFSPEVAGYYSLSHRILSLPMSLIGQSVGQVFFERAAREKDNPAELARITLSIYKQLLLLGAVILSIVTFYGDLLFPFIFGGAWNTAGKYAQWMSLWLIFVLTASPLSILYTVLEKQMEGLFVNAILFLSRAGVVILALVMKFSDIEMIAYYSIIGVLVYFVVSMRVLRLVHIRFFEIIKSTLLILLPVFVLQFTGSLFLRKIAGLF